MAGVSVQMEALKAQAIACTACGLAETRLNVVFGSRDSTAKLVIVAEGPLAMDDKTTPSPKSARNGSLNTVYAPFAMATFVCDNIIDKRSEIC